MGIKFKNCWSALRIMKEEQRLWMIVRYILWKEPYWFGMLCWAGIWLNRNILATCTGIISNNNKRSVSHKMVHPKDSIQRKWRRRRENQKPALIKSYKNERYAWYRAHEIRYVFIVASFLWDAFLFACNRSEKFIFNIRCSIYIYLCWYFARL